MALRDGEMKDRPKEALKNLANRYAVAHREGMTLSQLLEHDDPSHEWPDEDRKIKAFGRVMQASGFRFKSDPAEGLWADEYGDIAKHDEGRALIPEWCNTIWRRTLMQGYDPQVRIFGMSEDVVGGLVRPYTDKPGVYEQALTPGIRLADVVSLTTPIQGTDYRSSYLVEPAVAGVRWSRIAEKADIPRSTIGLAEHTIRLLKYGRGIEMSYEAARRIRVDKIALWLSRSALQVEADRVAQAIDIMINGDGNASTAATAYTQGGLDTGTTLTVKAWLAFKAKWKPPYRMNFVFARETELLNLQLLQFPNNNPFLWQMQTQGGFGSISPMQDINGGVVQYGQTDAVPATVYMGVDARLAIERITEIGSDIQETTRFIERQTELLTFTENDGFGVIDNNAVKTLTMS